MSNKRRVEPVCQSCNKPAARKWEQEQRRLIGMRSPEQIARMEAAIEGAF